MFVLAEFLFDFPFKNFSLFWLLFWEPFETHSSPFWLLSVSLFTEIWQALIVRQWCNMHCLLLKITESKKRATSSFEGTESIFIC